MSPLTFTLTLILLCTQSFAQRGSVDPIISHLVKGSESKTTTVSPNEHLSSHIASSNEKNAEDLAFLLQGVDELYTGGTPGTLSVYGSSAFPVVAGQLSNDENNWQYHFYHPVVAATRIGNGRMIGIGHDAFVYPASNYPGNIQFLLNAIYWTGKYPDGNYPRVALLLESAYVNPDLADFFREYQLEYDVVINTELQDYSQLAGYEVVLSYHFFSADISPILREYVEGGGGLIVAWTSWAWGGPVDGHFGDVFPANKVSSIGGFVWSQAYSFPTTQGGSYNTSLEHLTNTHVQDAWSEVKQLIQSRSNQGSIQGHGGQGQGQSQTKAFNDDPNKIYSVLDLGLQCIPPKDSFWTQSNFYNEAFNVLLRKSLLS